MAREKGIFNFPGNFEIRFAEPFDARSVVATKDDLTSLTTWDSGDGNAYVYPGMLVSVVDDTTAANNGVYQLVNPVYANIDNWVKLANLNLTDIPQSDWNVTDTSSPSFIQNKPSHDDLSGVNDAGTSVSKGHITDGTQSIAGAKTFLAKTTHEDMLIKKEALFEATEVEDAYENEVTVDWTQGNKQKIVIDDELTINFEDPSPGYANLLLIVVMDSGPAGSYDVDWDSTIKWMNGEKPDFTPEGEDIVTFVWDGENYYGAVIKDFRVPD